MSDFHFSYCNSFTPYFLAKKLDQSSYTSGLRTRIRSSDRGVSEYDILATLIQLEEQEPVDFKIARFVINREGCLHSKHQPLAGMLRSGVVRMVREKQFERVSATGIGIINVSRIVITDKGKLRFKRMKRPVD